MECVRYFHYLMIRIFSIWMTIAYDNLNSLFGLFVFYLLRVNDIVMIFSYLLDCSASKVSCLAESAVLKASLELCLGNTIFCSSYSSVQPSSCCQISTLKQGFKFEDIEEVTG